MGLFSPPFGTLLSTMMKGPCGGQPSLPGGPAENSGEDSYPSWKALIGLAKKPWKDMSGYLNSPFPCRKTTLWWH